MPADVMHFFPIFGSHGRRRNVFLHQRQHGHEGVDVGTLFAFLAFGGRVVFVVIDERNFELRLRLLYGGEKDEVLPDFFLLLLKHFHLTELVLEGSLDRLLFLLFVWLAGRVGRVVWLLADSLRCRWTNLQNSTRRRKIVCGEPCC